MTSTFTERFAELRHRMGLPENLHGEVEVNQVYAHYQHAHLEFRHPRGGQAYYLTAPLMTHWPVYLEAIARTALDDGGEREMARAMEHLSGQVELLAPVEFADLRRSGHPRVTRGARTTYDRQPKVHRLTEAELRVKNRLRKLPPEILGWIWWHVMRNTKPPPRHSRWAG
jgi:hypothetical protein